VRVSAWYSNFSLLLVLTLTCILDCLSNPIIADKYDSIRKRQVVWVSGITDFSVSCRLGERLDMNDIKTIKLHKSHIFHGHEFQFPQQSEVRMCVPQKNGNRNWGTLLHRLWFGNVPTVSEMLKNMDRHSVKKNPKVFKQYKLVLLIARNPYTRILSQYLNHIAGSCVNGILGCRKRSSQTFEDYVKNVYSESIKRKGNVCLIDKHLCWQYASCKSLLVVENLPVVLKLEHQPLWWSCFLSLLEVNPQILEGEEWLDYAKRPCYYTPSGACGGKMPSSQNEIFVGPVHGTNATGRVGNFYTKMAAKLVTKMYEYDFRLLKYPIWEGPPEPFHPNYELF